MLEEGVNRERRRGRGLRGKRKGCWVEFEAWVLVC